MTTILITGVSGFCGGHLVRRLRREGDIRIVGLDIHRRYLGTSVIDEYISADMRQAELVEKAVLEVQPDFVFNLAGLTSGTIEDLFQVNLLGGINLLEALRKHAPQVRLLIVGSAAEYGYVSTSDLPIRESYCCAPSGVYALSKHALTLTALDYARRYALKTVIARPFNIVGAGVPATLVIGAVLQRVKEALDAGSDPQIAMGSLDAERDFVTISDVVDAYVKMVKGDYWGEVFNICSGHPHSIRFVIERLLSFSPRPVGLRVDPLLLRPHEVKIVYGCWQKAYTAFGFKPDSDLDNALREAWQYAMGKG